VARNRPNINPDRDSGPDGNGYTVPTWMVGVARDAGLGARLHWYESRRRVPTTVVIAVALLTAFTGLMCYASARIVLVEHRADVAGFVVTAGLITGTTLVIWFLRRRDRRYLAVHQQGLVFAGDRVTAVAASWDDVVDVRHLARTAYVTIWDATLGSIHKVAVLTTRGDFRLTDEFPAIAEIGALLLDVMTRRIAPDMRSQIKVGESVNFDRWSLSPDGLMVGEWLWEWADIAEVVIRNGKLRVTCVDGAPGATIEIGNEESATVNAAVDLMLTFARTGQPPL
jgi:hypothetical protein